MNKSCQLYYDINNALKPDLSCIPFFLPELNTVWELSNEVCAQLLEES